MSFVQFGLLLLSFHTVALHKSGTRKAMFWSVIKHSKIKY